MQLPSIRSEWKASHVLPLFCMPLLWYRGILQQTLVALNTSCRHLQTHVFSMCRIPYIHVMSMLSHPLPLRFAVPFQLAIAAAQIYSDRAFVCAAATFQPFAEAAPETCKMAQVVAYGTTGFLPSVSSTVLTTLDPGVCQGVSAIWLLQLYIDIVIILLLPTLCTYALEFQAKKNFLLAKNLRLEHASEGLPGVSSWYLGVIVGMTFLSMLWVLLEAIIRQLAPSC